nr:MAG TPA: tail tape measure protein [Caudoviricetes sp.]
MVGALHSVEGQFPDTGHDAGRCPALSKRPGRMYGSRECNGKTRYRTTLSIETQLAMKPVEIEFLVKNNTRQGLSGVSGGIDAVDKDAAQARGRIQALKDEIVRLQKVIAQTPEMDQTENIRQIEALQRQLQALQAATKRTDLVPVSAPAAVRTYNGLNMSIQQLARELPVLSMGPQMFFMAISNNLPIFTDELARARKEYEAMIASGQKGVPVWRQVLSSLLSWQTALAVGITLTVAYGKEIGNWVANLFRGKKALDTARMASERFQNTMLEGARNAQQEVVKLNLLYRAATDNARATDDRREAVRKLKEEFSGYFKNLSDEQIMLGQANDTYKELIKNIYKYAKAQAAFKSLVDIEQQELFFNNTPDIEQFQKAYDKYLEAQKDVADKRKIYDAATWTQRGNASKVYKDLSWAETILADAEESVSYWQERIFEEIRKNKGGEEIIDEIEEKFDGNLGAFLQFLAEQRTKLAAVAEQAQLLENPSGTPSATGSAPASTDQLTEQYKAAVRRQQQSLDDQRVELIENEFDREREAIRLNYEKNRQEYERQEQQTLALIRKLRESGADIDSNAEKTFMAGTSAAIAQAAEIRDRELADVDKKEEASYAKLLEKYETYQQGRLRIARKYDQDIAALASNPEAQQLAREAKQKALDDFTEQFASQFPEFEAWADRVVAASVKKLESLVIEAQEELENLQSETPNDSNAIAVAQAKLRKAEQQLAKKQNQTEQETTDTTSWTELHRVLTDVIGTFNEVGDAVGGAGGTIIATAGDIAGSTLQIINAVQAYRKAQAASNTLGMASGILGGISAGIGALTTIVNLFKGGETSMERNLRLSREFNEELRIMKERSRIDSDEFDNIFGDRVYDRYKQNIDVVRTSLEELEKVRERILSRGEEKYQLPGEWRGGAGTGLSGLFRYEKTWENIADSIANMQVQTRHSTWFRSAKYQSLGSLLPELFTDGEVDMDALRQFVEEGGETFQHLARENQEMLREMVDDWETYEEALTAVRDYLQDIFGDLGSTLTDALVDAFENGTDAANTFVDSVGQALRLLGKRMASSIVFGKLFEDTQKRIEKVMQSDLSDEERFAQWSETMKSLVSDAMEQQDDFNRLWEEFRRIAKENGLSIDEEAGTSQQSGKAGAIQTVTQDSFSRVEGLVTSVQIHSAKIDENIEGIVPVLKGSLEAMNAIRENTEPIPQIYELLQTIKRDGLKAI